MMVGLRKIKFALYSNPAQAEVYPDQVFLSKLTGILAFKKMARNGIEIKFVLKDPQAGSRKCAEH